MDGEAANRGFDPLELPPDRFLNWIWFMATRGITEEADRLKFVARIEMPPKGVEPTSGVWSAEGEKAAFSSFMSEFQNTGEE